MGNTHYNSWCLCASCFVVGVFVFRRDRFLYRVMDKERKGLYLKDKEIRMLLILYNQRFLTTKQLQRCAEIKDGGPYANFTRRLKKFCEYNLLVRQERTLGRNGFRFYYYRIGVEGVKILHELGMIASDEYEHVNTTQRNLEHYLATQEVALHGILNSLEREVQSINPFHHPFIDEETNTSLIIPDWILRVDNEHYIHIEMDMGTEALHELQDKLVRYKKLAKQMSDYSHSVIYVSLDDTFNTRYFYGDKVRRTGNMKQQLLKERIDDVPNLEVYVVPIRRSKVLIERLLRSEVPKSMKERKINCEFAVQLISEFNEVCSYSFQPLQDEDVYITTDMDNRFYADKIYAVYDQNKQFVENVALVSMSEGHLFSLDRLDYLSHTFKKQKTKEIIDRIIAVYNDPIEIEEDVWGAEYSNIWIGDTQTWGLNLDMNPKFYRQVSPYKKEVTYYGE
jgi:hypothetical protein